MRADARSSKRERERGPLGKFHKKNGVSIPDGARFRHLHAQPTDYMALDKSINFYELYKHVVCKRRVMPLITVSHVH